MHTVLGDGETFSSAGYAEVMGAVIGHSILEMDEPEHHTYRSLVQQAFSRKAMERWETELVGAVVDEQIDEFVDDGHADLVRELTFPFPVDVIAALLGLPREDLPEFHRLAVELISVERRHGTARSAASEALHDYFAGDHRRAPRPNPRDDMISRARRTPSSTASASPTTRSSPSCRLLLPAGAETTYRSSSQPAVRPAHRPRPARRRCAPTASLMPQAIEEGIRWEPPLLTIMRTATRDTEVCGVPIPAGAIVDRQHRLGQPRRDALGRRPSASTSSATRTPHIGVRATARTCASACTSPAWRPGWRSTASSTACPNLRLDPDAPEPYITGITFRAPPRLDVVWG